MQGGPGAGSTWTPPAPFLLGLFDSLFPLNIPASQAPPPLSTQSLYYFYTYCSVYTWGCCSLVGCRQHLDPPCPPPPWVSSTPASPSSSPPPSPPTSGPWLRKFRRLQPSRWSSGGTSRRCPCWTPSFPRCTPVHPWHTPGTPGHTDGTPGITSGDTLGATRVHQCEDTLGATRVHRCDTLVQCTVPLLFPLVHAVYTSGETYLSTPAPAPAQVLGNPGLTPGGSFRTALLTGFVDAPLRLRWDDGPATSGDVTAATTAVEEVLGPVASCHGVGPCISLPDILLPVSLRFYCTVLFCIVLYCTVLYCIVLHYILLSSTGVVPRGGALHQPARHPAARKSNVYCSLLCCTALHCTVLYCTVLYCTVLYCTVLYCTVLYCTVL